VSGINGVSHSSPLQHSRDSFGCAVARYRTPSALEEQLPQLEAAVSPSPASSPAARGHQFAAGNLPFPPVTNIFFNTTYEIRVRKYIYIYSTILSSFFDYFARVLKSLLAYFHLQRMFEYDPCRRASAIEALHSPFCTPYRTDFSMEPFFPFEGIQKFPSGSPSLQSGPGSPVAQYFRQPTVTPTTASEMETAAPDSSTAYPHQHGGGGGGSSSGGSASTNRFGADVMNERSSIEPQHRRGMSKATSFQCIFNKVTPEPTEECAASDPQDMMMKHYEGDRPNDILVAELSQTIRDSRSALEAENNDLMLSVLGGSGSSSRPHRNNGDANAISPLARSDSFADISARYDLPNSVPCLVASGSSYRHADGHSHIHSLVVGGGGSQRDNLKDGGADENAVSNGQLARKLSLHYPIDEDAIAERDGSQKEKASLALIEEEKKSTHVQDALGKRPLNQMKRRNQPIQDLFEPPLKKQGALTQPGHLWNSKACLREEMDLSIRSDIDEPALEVAVVDKLKRVKRSSKPADQPPSSASVSLQRPCTRGTKKL
jgi:hypothetical protein